MNMVDAFKLNTDWGDKPCVHPRLEREYHMGMHTGDVHCTTCGAAFPSREAAEQDRGTQRQRQRFAVNAGLDHDL